MRQYPRASLYIFQCQHGKTCNFIADCPECAREEINSLRTKLAAAEKDAERYRHILRQQWHGHISNLT
ncbi:MAG TPA: hypothetical protein VEA39_06155, partial [Methylophilaceae bacterium]|nr:hypothetical protein [Methylophilaceae bacterium]